MQKLNSKPVVLQQPPSVANILESKSKQTVSGIVIIPGENDIFENMTPPNSTADVIYDGVGKPCQLPKGLDNKTYTKMRVPNWVVEGYQTVDVEQALCLMNQWLKESSAKEDLAQEKAKTQDSPKTDKKSNDQNNCVHTQPNVNCCGCGPCSCDPSLGLQEICECEQTHKKLIKSKRCCKIKKSKAIKNCADTKTSTVADQHKTCKRIKTNRCKSKECSKSLPDSENSLLTQLGGSQTSVTNKPVVAETTCCQPSPDSPNSPSIAEITAYLQRGKSCIRQKCNSCLVDQFLANLFGSKYSEIDGIEIRKFRDSESFTLHKDQSTSTVESSCCQTEIEYEKNAERDICHSRLRYQSQIQHSNRKKAMEAEAPRDRGEKCNGHLRCQTFSSLQRCCNCGLKTHQLKTQSSAIQNSKSNNLGNPFAPFI